MADNAEKHLTEEKTEQTVTITQAKLDELIREAQGRAGRQHRQEAETLASQKTALEAELAAAKDALAKATTPAEKKEASEDVQSLKDQIAEMKNASRSRDTELEQLKKQASEALKEKQRAIDEAYEIRKHVAIQNAASKVGFIDLDEVTQLTEKHIKWDSDQGRFIVLNDQGTTERRNAQFDPMTLEEYYIEVATKKPHWVRSDARGGVGSSQSQNSLTGGGKYAVEEIFGPKSDGEKAGKLFRENPKEYARLKQEARDKKIIGW